MFWIGLMIGFFIGGMAGYFICALCVIAKESDEIGTINESG